MWPTYVNNAIFVLGSLHNYNLNTSTLVKWNPETTDAEAINSN